MTGKPLPPRGDVDLEMLDQKRLERAWRRRQRGRSARKMAAGRRRADEKPASARPRAAGRRARRGPRSLATQHHGLHHLPHILNPHIVAFSAAVGTLSYITSNCRSSKYRPIPAGICMHQAMRRIRRGDSWYGQHERKRNAGEIRYPCTVHERVSGASRSSCERQIRLSRKARAVVIAGKGLALQDAPGSGTRAQREMAEASKRRREAHHPERRRSEERLKGTV